jgi:23S rRNA (pseudouridine1915-N3)-methyltransferase
LDKGLRNIGCFAMKIMLATVSPRRAGVTGPAGELFAQYVGRCAKLIPCIHRNFGSEKDLLACADDDRSRTRTALVVTDSQGQQLSSREIATIIGFIQDNGTQQLIVAIGPADGWSPVALARADKVVAFGRVTLPHELAAVVAAEQVYRALTIRAGHPYHSGH